MKKILIADDEPRILETFKRACNSHYEVSCANSGEEAIRYIKMTAFDLIVLDWRLKGKIEGKNVLAFSKQQFPKMPVLVVTASELSVKDIKTLGADECILKPYPDLLEKIKSLLPP